jgi:hypothetical protein
LKFYGICSECKKNIINKWYRRLRNSNAVFQGLQRFL